MKYELNLPEAKVPTKSHPNDAGYDMYTPVRIELEPSAVVSIDTGFRCELPKGVVSILKGRSGLAKSGIDPVEFFGESLLGGVIDCNYRGNWGVILKNVGHSVKVLEIGDRICQFVLLDVRDEPLEEGKLDQTDRAEQGFGSSDRPAPTNESQINKEQLEDLDKRIKQEQLTRNISVGQELSLKEIIDLKNPPKENKMEIQEPELDHSNVNEPDATEADTREPEEELREPDATEAEPMEPIQDDLKNDKTPNIKDYF